MSDKQARQMPLFVGERQSSLLTAIPGPPHGPPLLSAYQTGHLSVCVLGSGSRGNATVVKLGRAVILVDAGFGPRATDKRLNRDGLSIMDIQALCLTHLDQDHFCKTWIGTLMKLGVPIYVHAMHFADLMRLPGGAELRDAGLARSFDATAFEPIPGVYTSIIRLQHDREGTIGYRFDTPVGSIGYATDLGHAPPELIQHMAGVDLLCIECNYDEQLTAASSRPVWVNRRNMSDFGHLSNEQCFQAVRMIADASPTGLPRDVVLLHRSSQCNHPTKIREVFDHDPDLAKRLTLTEQRTRTRWLRVQHAPVPDNT